MEIILKDSAVSADFVSDLIMPCSLGKCSSEYAIEIYRSKVRIYHLLGQGKWHFSVVNVPHLPSDVHVPSSIVFERRTR